MKTFPSIQKIKVASNRRSRQNLSYTHITTTDFFRLQPTAILETVPRDKLSLSLNSFIRLSPLVLPTFGRMQLHHRAFFVPYRDVMEGFDEFINNDYYVHPHSGKQIFQRVHTTTNSSLVGIFLNGLGPSDKKIPLVSAIDGVNDTDSPNTSIINSTIKADILIISSSPTTSNPNRVLFRYRNFTNAGRHLYTLLRSLKLNINFNTSDETPVSILPLLCYAKAYLDWYYPAIWYKNETLSGLFKRTPEAWNANDLSPLLQTLYTTYDASYFTKAWVTPVSPYQSSDSEPEFIFHDVTNTAGYDSTSGGSTSVQSSTLHGSGTPSMYGVVGSDAQEEPARITTYSLNALRALTNYLVRNHATGFRPLQRYLTRYGVRINDDVLRRSRFLGHMEQDVKTTDIMSTADTGTGSVGDYAGAGASGGNGYLFKNEEFKDFGCIVVLSTLVPHCGFYQGRDRMYQHLSPLDFYTPEFDKLGCQAIRNDEVFCDGGLDPSGKQGMENLLPTPAASVSRQTWAYTPRYSEYKVSNDVLSGDFVVGTLNTNLSPFHLMRNVERTLQDWVDEGSSSLNTTLYYEPQPYTQKFVVGTPEQYNRIFQVSSSDMDHFFCHYEISITGVRPMSSIMDALDLTDGGREVSIPFGGVQLQ